MSAIFNLGGGEILLILRDRVNSFWRQEAAWNWPSGLGQGIREFKKATGNASEEMRHAMEETRPVASRRLAPVPADGEPTVSQVLPGPNV